MNEQWLHRKLAGIESWKENFGEGMERRGADGVSWYDLSLMNSWPCEPDTVIIVTSWMGQLKWLKAALTNYRLAGAYIILAYDNPLYAWMPANHNEIVRCFPNMSHYLLSHAFVMKHITYDADKRNGWFWNVRYAQGIIKQFKNIKYVFSVNGDCIWDKPEGMRNVIDMLGDKDLISGQSNEGMIHTASVLYKVEAFNAIFDHMAEIMRVSIIGSHSPEVMLRETVDELKIKVMHAPKQPLDPSDGSLDTYSRFDQDSTWKDLLGYKNLFAIYETQGNEGKEPLDKKYVDNYMDWIYFGGEEKETICQFWATGDRRYLYKFWDQWEDSDYNRLYNPLEYYGKEPILDGSN